MSTKTTPEELTTLMDSWRGGSDERYRHPFNRRLIYTEGIKSVAEKVGAYWLLDIIATEVAPICLKRWVSSETPSHLFEVKVEGSKATLKLSDHDDLPELWKREIEHTDFPEGKWTLKLSMDSMVDTVDVLVLLLVQED